MQITTQDSCL